LKDARFFVGKSGFTIDHQDGFVLIIHEHPGTGLFHDAWRRVEAVGGRLRITDLMHVAPTTWGSTP
jgi:hypothetical protein